MRPDQFSSWLTVDAKGLYCRPGGFHIDPYGGAKRAVITHGHSDHARPGHEHVLATAETLAVMKTRLGTVATRGTQTAAYGEPLQVGDVRVTLMPAGHVLGSAQVLPAALAREMRREQTGGVYRAQQPNARYEGYGLGWHVGDFDSSRVARVFAHSGALGSLLWCDAASQTGLVFLVQMPGAEVAALQREVVGMVKQIWGATP